MRNNVVLGAVGFGFLAVIAVSSWHQDGPAPLPPVQSTPVPDRYLPRDMLVPAVVYGETAQFERVENFAGVKRGERLLPAAADEAAADEAALAAVEPAVFAVPPAPGAGGPIDLMDGLTAPSLTSEIALSGPQVPATVPIATAAALPARPQTASAAIAASVRGLVRRIEEGSSGALLSFN